MNRLPLLIAFSLAVIVTVSVASDRAEPPNADEVAGIEAIRKLGGSVQPVTGGGIEVAFQLRGRNLTDAGLGHVANLSNVVSLNLRNTQITDKGLAHLRELKSLRHLHLEKTRVGDKGAAQLKSLENLVYLNLYGTKVTDRSLPTLASLKKLKRLYVWNTAVTKGGVARLRKQRPDLKVVLGIDLSKLPAAPPKEKVEKPKSELKWLEIAVGETPPKSKLGSNTRIVFENRSKETVRILWVSYGGELKLYGTLEPGKVRDQNTFSEASWLVTTLNNEPLGYFRTGSEKALAIIPAKK